MKPGGAAARYWLPVVVVLAGCATSAPKPEWQRDSTVNFAAYRTFALPATPGVGGNDPPLQLLDRNIRNAIAGEMRRKGYTETSEQPDLRMIYETTSADRVESSPVQVGVGVGSWGGNVGGSINVGSPSIRNYKEGTLVIHAVDNARNAEVWEGRVSSRIGSGGVDPAAVSSTVAEVMRNFPARPAGP
jgi:hypothetical protein